MSEFSRESHNEQLEALVTSESFDDELAIELFRDGPWPTWGFREYVDILRAAWSLNQSLPDDAEPFLVIGMDSDWDQYTLWFESPDPQKSFEIRMNREKTMINAVKTHALEAGEKALVHVGFDHSVTCHGERLATVLTREYGSRIFQVVLHCVHHEANDKVVLNDFLDELLAEASGGEPVGFDILGSPLAGVYDRNTIYYMAARQNGLGAFVQGYVFLNPIDDLHKCSWIDGFITDEHLDEAIAVARKLRWIGDDEEITTAEALNALAAERYPSREDDL